MEVALARHDTLLKQVFVRFSGFTFATGGDGFAVAFAEASDALAAAQEAQLALRAAELPAVRMAIHTGVAQERDGDYFGPEVNRAARILAIGHGGQVLLSEATRDDVERAPLRDLGEHRLRDLSRPERVYQLLIDGVENEFPPLRSLDRLPTNLPMQSTRFVGRTDDLERVTAAIDQARLVTLTGMGGVGKTRLALQVAADLTPTYRDGSWIVELGNVTDPANVPEAIRAVLGVKQQADRSTTASIAEYLTTRSMLLVLDNCEHVVAAAAELVEHILASSGASRILATSREGLAVAGERVIAIAPLRTPSLDDGDSALESDAVRLFLDRAADARDQFRVGPEDLVVLSRVCRRLEGIPLALELAAARVRSLTVVEVLEHLDQRFALLSAGRRNAPDRQQTLRSAIDWSYDLLDPSEQVVLRRLSVFTGGFDLDAARAVVADRDVAAHDVLDLLDQLVSKSLITADVGKTATRYRLLDTIADYGWEKLVAAEENKALIGRHASYYADLSERAGRGLRGPDEARWTELVEVEMENLREALVRSIDAADSDVALRIVAGLAVTGYRVGAPFGELALDAAALPDGDGHPCRPFALASGAWTALHLARYDQAASLGDAAVAAARDLALSEARDLVISRCLAVVAAAAATGGDRDRAIRATEERQTIVEHLDDAYETSQLLTMVGTLFDDIGAAERAMRLARETGNPTMLSYALSVLAILLIGEQPEQARPFLEEALSLASAVGNHEAEALARQALSGVATALGDHHGAARLSLESAEQLFRAGDRFYAFGQLWNVAVALDALGGHEDLRLLGAWLVRRGAVVAGLRPLRIDIVERLSPAELDELEPTLEAMSDTDAVEFARAAIEALATAPSPPDRNA